MVLPPTFQSPRALCESQGAGVETSLMKLGYEAIRGRVARAHVQSV